MIRPARHSDTAAIGRVYARTWKAAYRGLMPAFFLDLLTDTTCAPKPDHIASDRRLVAEADGTVVGTVTFDKGEIRSLYVLPEYWGRGEGFALFRAAEERLKEQGFSRITLWVQRDNARARAFLERQGMSLTGQTRETETAGTWIVEIQYERN